MKTMTLALSAALLALAACGSAEPDAPSANAAPAQKVEPSKPLKEADPEAYKMSVEGAMAEIPAASRANFQKLLMCVLQSDKKAGVTRPLDADLVRKITQHLKTNPNAAANCQA